jgi:hypothetical protein
MHLRAVMRRCAEELCWSTAVTDYLPSLDTTQSIMSRDPSASVAKTIAPKTVALKVAWALPLKEASDRRVKR